MSMPYDKNGTLDFTPVELIGSLPITQMFVSINGETTHSGVPTLFIRTFGCNVKCSYCDTPQDAKSSTTLDLSTIAQRAIDMVTEHALTDICITGGEPLIHPREVDALARYFNEKGYTVYIETNGTLPIITTGRDYSYIMDIKVPSANILGGFITDIVRDNLKKLKYKDEVKICFGNLADVVYAFEVLSGCLPEDYDTYNQDILLSPLYGTSEEIIQQVIDWTLNTKFTWLNKRHIHFQTQLHKVFNVK